MAGELLIFDAAASNIDGTNPGTALLTGPGTSYAIREFDAPAPQQTIQYAGSVDTEGSSPASRKHENRLISVTLLCATAAALRSVQDKIAKFSREGGTLKWVLPNAETIIFDVLAMDTFAPVINKLFYVRAGAFCEVQITLPAKPYGRGAEITLSDHVETTLPVITFTEATIKGDIPGTTRIVFDNDSGGTLGWLVWGLESLYYNASNAVFFQAEGCSLKAGTSAAAVGVGESVQLARNTSLPALAATVDLFDLSASALGHVGQYRVFARCYAPNTNAGIVSVRITWQPKIGGVSISNDWAGIVDSAGAADENEWMVLDLGQVILPVPVPGDTSAWQGTVQAFATAAADDVYVDWILLVPVLEGSGEVAVADSTGNPTWPTTRSVHVRSDGVFVSSANGLIPTRYVGDYPVVPASGLETRTTRFVFKAASGSGFDSAGDKAPLDLTIPDVSVQVFYTPRYLVVPTP